MDNKEVTVEVRETSISIQGAGVGNDTAATRGVLQNALDALDSDREKETFANEIVIKQ